MVKRAKNHPAWQRTKAPPIAVVSGELVAQKGRLRCPKCHAETDPVCGCGLGYVYIRPRDLAAKGLADDPTGSNRRIALKVGVTDKTVAAARLTLVATAENSAVRVGKDGISRRLPAPPAGRKRHVTVADITRDQYRHVVGTAKALHQELCISSSPRIAS
jgi:hypothetical protein